MFQFLKRHIIKAISSSVAVVGTITLVQFFRSEARASGHFLLFSPRHRKDTLFVVSATCDR